MKKGVILLCMIFFFSTIPLTTTEADATHTSLTYKFYFDEPEFNTIKIETREYATINMGGCLSIGKEEGTPSLPVKFIQLVLPPMKTVSSIEIIGTPVKIKIEEEIIGKTVLPYQNERPLNIPYSKKIVVDNEVYTSNNIYPSKNYGAFNIGYSHGYAVLDLSINPIQFVPLNNKFFYYPELTVKINLKTTGDNRFYSNNIEDREWVSSLVSNPEVISDYANNMPSMEYSGGLCDPEDDYDYVIITTTENGLDDWETNPTTPYNWTSLMDKHDGDGLECVLVTKQEILACSDYYNSTPLFNDTQARIREFIRDAYQDWGTRYILIGGDSDTLPARQLYYSYEGNIDSDLYWSNLDNSFNADADSIWGEIGDAGFDLYSEIYIGRITCDIPQDVSNWLKKSFCYADETNETILDNAAFYGGDSTWLCQGDDFVDFGAIKTTDNWLGPNPGHHGEYPSWLGTQYGFETWNENHPNFLFNLSVRWTAEPPNTGWQGGSESVAVNGLKNAINNDEVTYLSALAHANYRMACDVYYTTWEANYHNTKPFFITDMGCHCGDFDVGDGIIESMLFHSDTELAFGCAFNTGYGWGSFQDTNSSSSIQMKSFWDYFFNVKNTSQSEWQFGKGHAWSKDVMAPTISWTYVSAPDSWRGVIEGCLLFGDPAQLFHIPVASNISVSGVYPMNNTLAPCLVNLSITVNHLYGNNMNISWYSNATGEWLLFGQNISVGNGTYTQYASWATTPGEQYYWKVYINDSVDNLSFCYGFFTTAGDGSEENPYQVACSLGVESIREDLDAYYILMENISFDEESFTPIGSFEEPFAGHFDGLNRTIVNLCISESSSDMVGLFSYISGTVENLGLVDVDVTGDAYVGGIVGYLYGGNLTNCYVTGNIYGDGLCVGGLAGVSDGDIVNCYSNAIVESNGGDYVGGIVGQKYGSLINSYSTGDVTGDDFVGGLVGQNHDTISNCYSTGYVDGGFYVGGLVGQNVGSVTTSYWDTQTSGRSSSSGGTGRTTAQMTYPYQGYNPPCSGLYEEWDLDYYMYDIGNIWVHDDNLNNDNGFATLVNDGYPIFWWRYILDEDIPPLVFAPNPENNSVNQELTVEWNVSIYDVDGDIFNWSIECSNGQNNSDTDDTNGTKELSLTGLAYTTHYIIWVNATDIHGETNIWFDFTTKNPALPPLPNYAPVVSSPNPADDSTNNQLSLTWSCYISDANGDTFDYTIYASNSQHASGTDTTNGTKSLSLSGLEYKTLYTVWVNTTDGEDDSEYVYHFTTKNRPAGGNGGGGGGGGSSRRTTTTDTEPQIPSYEIPSSDDNIFLFIMIAIAWVVAIGVLFYVRRS